KFFEQAVHDRVVHQFDLDLILLRHRGEVLDRRQILLEQRGGKAFLRVENASAEHRRHVGLAAVLDWKDETHRSSGMPWNRHWKDLRIAEYDRIAFIHHELAFWRSWRGLCARLGLE